MPTKRRIQSGMTSLEIKFQVYKKYGSITAAARDIQCGRSQLSYCILRKRISPELRKKLARALDTSVEELFGDAPPDEEPEQDLAKSPERKDEDE